MATVYKDTETGRTTKAPPRKRARGKVAHKGNQSGLSTAAKKAAFIDLMRNGLGTTRALAELQLSDAALSYWRKTDEQFKADHERVKLIKSAPGEARKNMPSFEEFCEKYLDTQLFKHHFQWIDLLEGREPRDLHPSQVYVPGEPETVLINTPPEHPAHVDTPIFTRNKGWITVGDVQPGDWIAHRTGTFEEVYDTWMPDSDVDLFEVEFGTGDVIVTSAEHKWHVRRSAHHELKEMSTAEIMGDLKSPSGQLKWRVEQGGPLELPDADVFDPYLFGYWLGDGDKNGSQIAVGDQDVAALVDYLDFSGYDYSMRRDSRGRSWSVYVKGIRKHLPLGDKSIPALYLQSSIKQRTALLQGLMDSDGTISAKDGRARWVQHGRPDLCRDVYRLIASLGYQPRMRTYGPATEVTFKPDSDPVFRLERKAARQFTREGNRRTDFRTISDVRPAGRGMVKCLSVLTDDNTFLIGDALIPTRNAKSTTITMNYVTYRICEDPNIRIIIVSKTQEMAKKFLRGIKDRLAGTGGTYRQLQIDFAPEGGFDGNSSAWTADSIYISGDLRDSGEKDPTVQALGIRGHIYGSRADLIIMDDCVDMGNAHEYAKHIDWIQNQVLNRLSYPGGRLLLVGTRLQPVDLYSEILKDEYYGEEKSPWTYLTQPAVLEFAEKTADWVTLWPWTNRPPVSLQARKLVQKAENGLYPMWSGLALSKRRAGMSPRNWAMVYQQEQVVEDAIFSVKNVTGCVDGARAAGPMVRGAPGHREAGMDGLSIVGGFDPAITGNSAAVILGVDRNTGVRWVLDVWTRAHCKPDDIFDKIKELTVKYHVAEWRIEKNAMNLMVTQNREIRNFLASRGCLLKEHFTGKNKWDADFGVASMSMMFEGWEQKKNLIHLPSRSSGEGMKAFIEQLTTWFPETKGKTDTVMALWFAEIRARELVNELESVFQMNNPYRSGRDNNKTITVDLDYASQAAFAGHVTGEWWS